VTAFSDPQPPEEYGYASVFLFLSMGCSLHNDEVLLVLWQAQQAAFQTWPPDIAKTTQEVRECIV
jgi:hypothetical protein